MADKSPGSPGGLAKRAAGLRGRTVVDRPGPRGGGDGTRTHDFFDATEAL